jgi:hypothetical protein
MPSPIRILLQTTIPYTEDDWHVGRFSLLKEHLASLMDAEGRPLVEVTARDREAPGDGYARDPRALDDVKTYVRNAALWLAPERG